MKFTPGTVCLMSVLLILSGCANQETGSVSESIQENNERIGTNAESNNEITEVDSFDDARALLNDPVLILADEPTGNLDPETSGQIVQLLHDICHKGTAVIMTTHNYTLVHNYPARIVKCENACLSDVGE